MKIAAFFPDGVGIRNFIVGSFISHASQRSEIFAFHNIPDEHLNTYQNGFDARVHWRRCIPYVDAPMVCFLRKSLSQAHLRLHDTMAMRYALKLPVRGSTRTRAMTHAARAFGRVSASPRHIQRLGQWHDRAAQRLSTVDQYKELFEELQPNVLFCSHQRPLELVPAVLAARQLGIPTATFIFSWDNITSKGRIATRFDHYLVWSRHMREELLQFYPEVDPENIHVVGTPQFDPYADQSLIWSHEEFCKQVGADPKRKLICYSGGEPGTTPEDQDHLRILMELVRDRRIEGNPQVLLRPAPVTRADERIRYGDVCRDFPELIYSQPRWVQTQPGNWASVIPSREDVQLLANLTRYVDVNVNVASTMTLDFAIRDKPVVNVGFNANDPPPFGVPLKDYYYQFEHYRPVIELGAARLADNPEQLAQYVNAYLKDPTLDQQQRRNFVELELDLPIGRSSEKILAALDAIAA